MNCECINIINRLKTSLGELISALVNNRISSSLPSTDDGSYQPNFNLLDGNNSSSFDSNILLYICMILLAIVTLSSMLSRRRRQLGGNGSSLH